MLRDFYASSAGPGIEPIAAAFSMDKAGKLLLSSLALFKKTTLVGYVDNMQAVALTTLLGKKPFGDAEIALTGQKSTMSIRITQLKVKKRVNIVDDQPMFTLDISATGRIMDNRTQLDPSDPAVMEQLNGAFQETNHGSLPTALPYPANDLQNGLCRSWTNHLSQIP